MTISNFTTVTNKSFILQLLSDLLYFPLWWYSRGLINCGKFCLGKLLLAERILALRIKLKNLFRPMFQDYTAAGLLIGVPIRLVMLIFSMSIFILVFTVLLAALLVYLLLPLLVIAQIFRQL